jgi:signal peptidase I
MTKKNLLETLVTPGDVITMRDKTRYKVYIEPKGLYLENMDVPRDFLDIKKYNNKLNYPELSSKDIMKLFNPRTKNSAERR